MSQENVDEGQWDSARAGASWEETVLLVQALWDAVNRGDDAVTFTLVHPEVECEDHVFPNGGRYHGHRGLATWSANLLGIWKDYKFEVGEFVALPPDRLLVFAEVRGEAKIGGLALTEPAVFLFRMQDAKCRQLAVYRTEDEALAAVGLAE